MNAWFGAELRRELVKLMSDSPSTTSTSGPSKNDTHSAISQRLSIDSLEGRNERDDSDDSESDVYDDLQITWGRT
jgi:hypothetical protein